MDGERIWLANIKHTDKHKSSKASIQVVQPVDSDSEDDLEVELDDGVIYRIQPKSKNQRNSNWKNNFAKKFDLQQRGQTWQRKPSNSGKTIKTGNEYSRSSNHDSNYKKNSNPNGTWECRMCRADGRNPKVRNDMKCPVHNVRPNKFKNIPLAKVSQVSHQNAQNPQNEVEHPGEFNALRARFYGDLNTDTSE